MTTRELAAQAKYLQKYLYQELELSQEQAEALVYYTQDEQLMGSHGWEALDFEYDSFQRILTAEQWPRYQARYEEALALHEGQLRQDDQRAAADLPWAQQELRFYQEQYIPALYQLPGLFPFVHTELAKEEYLVAECRAFLQQSRKALLRHEQQTLLPRLAALERAADGPTRAVLNHVLSKAGDFTHWRFEEELKKIRAWEASFHREAFIARHGKPIEQVATMRAAASNDEKQLQRNWTWELLWLNQRWPEFQRQSRTSRKKK